MKKELIIVLFGLSILFQTMGILSLAAQNTLLEKQLKCAAYDMAYIGNGFCAPVTPLR